MFVEDGLVGVSSLCGEESDVANYCGSTDRAVYGTSQSTYTTYWSMVQEFNTELYGALCLSWVNNYNSQNGVLVAAVVATSLHMVPFDSSRIVSLEVGNLTVHSGLNVRQCSWETVWSVFRPCAAKNQT